MKTELSKIERLKKFANTELGMDFTIELAEMKLDDGVTVIEAEIFEAGQQVFVKSEDGQSIPLPIGEYMLEDGMQLVVTEEGVIAEIREPQAEQPEEEKEVAAAEKPTETPVAKKVIESVSKETHFSVEEKQELLDRLQALEAKLSEETPEVKAEETPEVELSEEEVKPIIHNPENKKPVQITKLQSNRKGKTIEDRVRATLYNN